MQTDMDYDSDYSDSSTIVEVWEYLKTECHYCHKNCHESGLSHFWDDNHCEVLLCEDCNDLIDECNVCGRDVIVRYDNYNHILEFDYGEYVEEQMNKDNICVCDNCEWKPFYLPDTQLHCMTCDEIYWCGDMIRCANRYFCKQCMDA